MSSTLSFPFTRFIRQVSNGCLRAKYSRTAMMIDCFNLLKQTNWKVAVCPPNAITTVVNKVSQSDAEKDEQGNIIKQSTFTSFLNDAYDAYVQGGDADQDRDSMCCYAGCVAYRFTLPDNYTSAIENIKIVAQRSRYLRAGARVALYINSNELPSDDWNVIRGDADGALVSEHHKPTTTVIGSEGEVEQEIEVEGVEEWGFLGQDVPTLMDSKAGDGELVFTSTDHPEIATMRGKYLWVYLTCEDYTSYWTWYNSTEPRYYACEGSASLIPSVCSVTFAGEEQTSTQYKEFKVATDGVVPSMASDDGGSQAHHITVQLNGDPLPEGELGMIVKELIAKGNYIHKVVVSPILGNRMKDDGMQQFAAICGSGFAGTFRNIPGLLIYDCKKHRLVTPTGKDYDVRPLDQVMLKDKDKYPYVANCLFNYDDGTSYGTKDVGFVILPFMRNITTPDDGSYYSPHFETVRALLPTGEGFITFHYDGSSSSIKSITNIQAGNLDDIPFAWRLSAYNIIGCPTMVTTKFMDEISTSTRNCTWCGFYKFGTDAQEMFGNVLFRQRFTSGTPNWQCSGLNVLMTQTNGQDQYFIHDVIPMPRTYRHNKYHAHGANNYANVLFRITGGVTIAISSEESATGDFGNNLRGVQWYKNGTDSSTRLPMMASIGIGSPLSDLVASGIDVGLSDGHISISTVQPQVKKDNTLVEDEEPDIVVVRSGYETRRYDDSGYYTSINLPNTTTKLVIFKDMTSLVVDEEGGVGYGSYIDLDEDAEYTSPDDYEEYAKSVCGLRYAFGKFHTSQFKEVDVGKERIGASFQINDNTYIGLDGTTKRVKAWQIFATAFVLPFSCPSTFKTKKIKVDWSDWKGANPGEVNDLGCKINVWLFRDQFITNHPKFLSNPDIYIGGSVNGGELVGTIDPFTYSKTKEFEITELTSNVATIILTGYLDQDLLNVTKTSGWGRSYGVGKVKLNLQTLTLSEGDTAFKPQISLLGL